MFIDTGAAGMVFQASRAGSTQNSDLNILWWWETRHFFMETSWMHECRSLCEPARMGKEAHINTCHSGYICILGEIQFEISWRSCLNYIIVAYGRFLWSMVLEMEGTYGMEHF
jgi:hypothetical protein